MSKRLGALLCVAVTLSACSSNTVKDTLGLYRSAPDEYRVVARPPLSVPPQFGLRAPSVTDSQPGYVPADKQAESLLLGEGSTPADTAVKPVTAKAAKKAKGAPLSSADAQFLKQAGAEAADPAVREQLVEEHYQRIEKKESENWLDKLDWSKEKKEPLVDAKKEAERIQTNEDAGKPVTEGETPQVKGRDTGLLGEIFDY